MDLHGTEYQPTKNLRWILSWTPHVYFKANVYHEGFIYVYCFKVRKMERDAFIGSYLAGYEIQI